jgi:hypothetical protein
MPDTILIYQPFAIALVLLALGLGGLKLRRRALQMGLRRGALVFSCGAILLAFFFLFNAGFSALTWWRL